VARVEALTRRLDQARQAPVAEAASVFQRVLENEFSEEATEGWREVPAAELFEIVSGQASPLDPQFKHLPYLGPEHVESSTGRVIGERVSVEELNMKSGKYVFSPGHVVYSKIRPALRKVCLPDYDGLCSADMYPLKPNDSEVTREFLLFLLLAPSFSQYAVDNSDRNAMPKINREALFGFTFRVPKKPEQKRIAKLLLALRGKLDELQRLQREVAAELASFTPALLAKAFRGEL
jgi:type I restriction enzyme S subunit